MTGAGSIETAPIGSAGMIDAEWAELGLGERCNPLAELLGLVVNELGRRLGEADWTHGWTGLDMVRYEWAGGPSINNVLTILLPVYEDGEIYGVPGLRLRSDPRSGCATMRWLPAPETGLHLTRLPARRLRAAS